MFALLPAVLLAHEGQAHAGCQFDLNVKNTATTDIKVTQISTSTTNLQGIVPVYKKQWSGTQAIKAGETQRFTFTVDFCPSTKDRDTKVFFTKSDSTKEYEFVGHAASGDTQSVK